MVRLKKTKILFLKDFFLFFSDAKKGNYGTTLTAAADPCDKCGNKNSLIIFRYANNTNTTFAFHGPRGAEEEPGPVKWTRPYFDCGRSNMWKVAAVVPVVDIYPRHTQFR